MRRILLFAYGTLLDERIQRRVFGRVIEAIPAHLAGWRVLARAVRSRYPGIVRAEGKSVAGGLLRIDAQELTRADVYEDAPDLYRRKRMTLRTGRQAERGWVYVPTPSPVAGIACDRRPGLAGRR